MKLDYMHPLIETQDLLAHAHYEEAQVKQNIIEYSNKLENLFKKTKLYIELMEKYEYVKLQYIDEDLLELVVKNKLIEDELYYNTQEISDKLQID